MTNEPFHHVLGYKVLVYMYTIHTVLPRGGATWRRGGKAHKGGGGYQSQGSTRDGGIYLPAGLGNGNVTCTPQRRWFLVTGRSPAEAWAPLLASVTVRSSNPWGCRQYACSSACPGPLPGLFPCHALANPSGQFAVCSSPNPKCWDSHRFSSRRLGHAAQSKPEGAIFMLSFVCFFPLRLSYLRCTCDE